LQQLDFPDDLNGHFFVGPFQVQLLHGNVVAGDSVLGPHHHTVRPLADVPLNLVLIHVDNDDILTFYRDDEREFPVIADGDLRAGARRPLSHPRSTHSRAISKGCEGCMPLGRVFCGGGAAPGAGVELRLPPHRSFNNLCMRWKN
jgi:hypothetical protein